ncbi:MAG: hypothetical protein J7L14_03150 [Candidatus Diapherotrites archaeon]|nr:hypothetical protein [Candidatus Diapherotrites archaeon]
MDQKRIVEFLLNAKNYSSFGIPSNAKVRHIETHISHIFLVDRFAFKLKKAVKFPFLDFSTVKKRKFFCFRELSWNSRISPELYVGVHEIRVLDGKLNFSSGRVVDYLLQMRRMPSNSRMDFLLKKDKIRKRDIVALAEKIANFHISAKQIRFKKYSDANSLLAAIKEIAIILKNEAMKPYQTEIEGLISLSEEFFRKKEKILRERFKSNIKHCHGDLHSANIFFAGQKPIIFDCIEFNNALAYIDPASDIAFLTMDLKAKKKKKMARIVIENYNKLVKDNTLFEVLPLYESYRANVRAKVAALRIMQLSKDSKPIPRNLIAEFESYLELATNLLKQS